MAALSSEAATQQANALEEQAQKLQKVHDEQMEALRAEAAEKAAAAAKNLAEAESTAARAAEQAAAKLSDLQAAFDDARQQASSFLVMGVSVGLLFLNRSAVLSSSMHRVTHDSLPPNRQRKTLALKQRYQPLPLKKRLKHTHRSLLRWRHLLQQRKRPLTHVRRLRHKPTQRRCTH